MAVIPIYIPTYISDATYAPARVLPRLLFYNGQRDCEKFYVKDEYNSSNSVYQFPYFDNYNASGSGFPTTGSQSLLFYNEQPVYGSAPTASLYSNYWETYLTLIYNPRTRLLNASTIIPLADYFKMELNDIVELRGNYYHLRAINDYNLKNGECNVQLLGPILADALPFGVTPGPTPPPTTTTTTTTLSPNCVCYEVVVTSPAPPEGGIAASITYLPCDGGTNINRAFFNPGTYYQCARVIGGLAQIEFVDGTGTISPVGSCNSGPCPPSTTTSTSTSTSTTTTSSTTTTTTAPTTATLSWSFTESIGSSGYMDIYVNASVIESRVNTSSGTYNLQVGDTINVQVACFTCGSPNTYANAYSFSNRLILADAACVNNGEASILTANYTVVSGDIGNTITLNTFARCDSGCI
jgi:hypothetical protein